MITISEAPIPERIYLDHAATTPIRPEARAAMQEGFAIWANPSSPHAEGRKAKQALEDARERVKKALGWDGEVIFTSGASEAAEIALSHSRAVDDIVSAAEHDAVFQEQVRHHYVVPVGADGAINLVELRESLAQGADTDNLHSRFLVAAQHINSETGARQDISAIAKVVHENGGLLLVDCAQSIGKFPVPQEADMVIMSAHKFGGPIGVGALLVKDYAMLVPTGGHERGYRRGTENLPDIMGMAAVLEVCAGTYVDADILSPFAVLADAVRQIGGVWLDDNLADPTPYIYALAMPGMSGSVQLMRFDGAGISVSQGSACSSGTLKKSRVLEAMGIDDDTASRMIRVSAGWNTTRGDVERFCETWIEMATDMAQRTAEQRI